MKAVAPVFVFRTATAAPGTTLPAGSVNVPDMVPAPLFCAKMALVSSVSAKIQTAARRTTFFSFVRLVSKLPPVANAPYKLPQTDVS